MTSLVEHLDRAAADARRMMDDRVADWHEPDPPVYRPVVEGFRGDEPVVVMIPSKVDRDAALHAARIQAVGFGCDVIAVTTDARRPVGDYIFFNPVTGRRTRREDRESAWGPGEMQQAALEHGALEKGWLTDTLMTTVVNRAGDMRLVSQDYRTSRRTTALGIVSWEITWAEGLPALDTRDSEAEASGIIPEALVDYMNEVPIDVMMGRLAAAGVDLDVSSEAARAAMDCATIKMLPRVGFDGAAMLMTDSEERAAVIEASLKGYGEMWRRGGAL